MFSAFFSSDLLCASVARLSKSRPIPDDRNFMARNDGILRVHVRKIGSAQVMGGASAGIQRPDRESLAIGACGYRSFTLYCSTIEVFDLVNGKGNQQ
jgi:hypothetical protein